MHVCSFEIPIWSNVECRRSALTSSGIRDEVTGLKDLLQGVTHSQQYYDDPTRENVGTKEVEKAGTMKNFKQLQSSTIVGKDDPLKAYSWIIDMDILLRTGMI